MADYSNIRKSTLNHWKSHSNRVFKVTDNFSNSYECNWQSIGSEYGYNHISIFCSIAQFGSHVTDLLRDYRFDKYNYDQSEEVNEVIFRYYSRIFLVVSEILTDFQDLYILADEKITTKDLSRLKGQDLKSKQDNARSILSNGTDQIKLLLDFINKICKHKTSNFHLCNNHIHYLFEDFHINIKSYKKRIELGNINNFTSYDPETMKKFIHPEFIVLPKLMDIIDVVLNCYTVLDNLFLANDDKFKFICNHFEKK